MSINYLSGMGWSKNGHPAVNLVCNQEIIGDYIGIHPRVGEYIEWEGCGYRVDEILHKVKKEGSGHHEVVSHGVVVLVTAANFSYKKS